MEVKRISRAKPKLRFNPVNPKNNFPKMEEKILEMWESENIYEKTQNLRSRSSESFTWLEGPPTANNVPHAGHALTRALKDSMLRYHTMKGEYVIPRIGGWDCHGLPVELEIEKKMGFNSKSDIEAYGIKEFNQLCRDSVLKYTDDWIEMSRRIGFWLDLENSYVTMTDDYIESVWWSLKTLYDKGLVYKGTRVAPYCSRCGTTLSSHELAQGYKDVDDTAIFIKFRSLDFENVNYLAWTTTPWTLLANVMLTVNPDITYVIVEFKDEKFLLAESLIEKALKPSKKDKKPVILEKFKGKELEGKKYEPIFPFFKDVGGNAFQVTLADYVTLEDGSGIVHSAPAFGADDAETGNKYGAPVLQPVNLEGKFTDDVPPLAGMWVKDADKKIIKMLKSENKLYRSEQYKHSYPHCWRCDTPLLYYGTDSWFVGMKRLRENLVANNEKVFWQPHYIKHGRFGNFIEGAVDWNLSRSRYWGTPLPVWICTDCNKIEFMGSKQDLIDKTDQLPDNFELHRPWVDEVTWGCECGGNYQRENYVIDTWYDSGSAPFAQYHYPFENKEEFEKDFPYNFITEAIDQTRGWFYSLLSISTALFDTTSFTSVLCMNHVLAEDGSKMSKSKGNTIHPKELFDTVGADAMRWYLCSTPAWNPMRFGKSLVGDAQRRVLNTLWNVYSFFVTNANVDNYNPTERMDVSERSNIDRWIISRLQSVIADVKNGMETMTFHTCVKTLDYFILEELSNWYVRRSRRRFYGKDLTTDKRAGYDTLYEVLTTLTRLMAPLTPFIVEELYQNLEHRLNPDNLMSIHMHLYPESDETLIDFTLESEMAIVLAVTNAARTARAEAGIKARQPLSELVVNIKDGKSQITKGFVEVIEKEINVKSINFVTNDAEFVDYKVQPMLKKLAPKVRGAIKAIKPYLESLSRTEAKQIVQSVNNSGKVSLRIDEQDWEFTSEELLVHALPTDGYIMGESKGVDVFLKTEITDDLRLEGLARGVIRHIQENRKKLELDYLDRINVSISTGDEMMKNAILEYKDYIQSETQADTLTFRKRKGAELQKIDGTEVALSVEPV
ncbi:MAG: isoleucine--tRNA ligase [Candidatus Heimdallarchaeota archaeon]|nr:isoleucine--tRNA ligase [Candidatus Heimdallarchaeota archaeon]